jgi:hypothetical protein
MADSDLVVLAEVYSDAEADLLTGFLESEGIDSMRASDDVGDQMPQFDFSRGIKILVRAEDEERARRILDRIQAESEKE